MSTLYIDRRHSELRHQGGALILSAQGERQSIPIKLLERIVISAKTQTDTTTLAHLAQEGVVISLIGGGKQQRLATVVGPLHNDVRRRLAQYRAHIEPARAIVIARTLLRHKIQGQRRLLIHARQQRPDLRHPLSQAIDRLEGIQRSLENDTMDLPRLRGLEGAAAAHYFAAYPKLFPAELGFTARRRRPPPDPVNALLSLSYTLIHAEAVQTIHSAGLDPYLGYLHEPDYGRESLAADLIEPLRPRIDRWIWELMRNRRLRPEQFNQREGGCYLDKSGRGEYYPAYEQAARPWRRWLRLAVYTLIRHLMEDTP